MLKYRLVLDTNVFISALLFGGRPEQLVLKWVEDSYDLLISAELLLELGHKLTQKFNYSQTEAKAVLNLLQEKGTQILVDQFSVVSPDENDIFLLQLAMAGQADFLVTGDKALLSLQEVGQTEIISIATALSLWEN